MKKFNYRGTFKSFKDTHTIDIQCNGKIQAFILLTAKAIENGKDYQLYSIKDENGEETLIKDNIEVLNMFI
jgi:hypothetical protein